MIYVAGLAAIASSLLRAQPLTPAAAATTPSFNCGLAKSAIDKTICADPKLAEADATMGRLYAAARTSAFGHGQSNELAAQRVWLKEREDCGVPDKRAYKSRAACLTGHYEVRNHELAVAALFTERALAIDTLRKLDPDAAPLYEAITLYAEAPAGWTWVASPQRPRMLGLLQPSFDRLRTGEHSSFGWGILEDGGIKEPADALKSEKNFIQFLQIASTYLGGTPIPRPLPCAAIVRRPELLDASDAVFGSTLDNFIFYPDCEATLPPLPQLERLREQINQSWPDCEGTIRYSAYRFYGRALNEARVASRSEINAFAKSREARRSVRMPRLPGVSPGLIAAAVTELSSYYQANQKVAPKDARIFATAKVRDIVGSGHNCGG